MTELSSYAHSQNLAIGLKNNPNIIPQVISIVDFSVSEQCHQYNECNAYAPFPNNSKAVFQIEYQGTLTNICNAAAAANRDGQKKTLDLNNQGTHC